MPSAFTLTGIRLVEAALPFLDDEAIVGLGVEGVPFIICFSHCSTGPVTKSPSSSSSPGIPP